MEVRLDSMFNQLAWDLVLSLVQTLCLLCQTCQDPTCAGCDTPSVHLIAGAAVYLVCCTPPRHQ